MLCEAKNNEEELSHKVKYVFGIFDVAQGNMKFEQIKDETNNVWILPIRRTICWHIHIHTNTHTHVHIFSLFLCTLFDQK